LIFFPLFATSVVDTGGNLPKVSLMLAANLPLLSLTPIALPPVSTTPAVLVAKFAVGVINTVGAP
jgi:hypothetical protein